MGLALAVAVGFRWYEPAVVDRLARRTGFGGAKAWAVLVVATLWLFLPALAGAEVGDDALWVVGPAVAGGAMGLGGQLLAVRLSSATLGALV